MVKIHIQLLLEQLLHQVVHGYTYNPNGYTQGLYLANSHDEVILHDNVGKKVDEYRW